MEQTSFEQLVNAPRPRREGVIAPNRAFGRKGPFTWLVQSKPGETPRDEKKIASLAHEYDRVLYPNRVLIAAHTSDGKAYCYFIYDGWESVAREILHGREPWSQNLFANAEENEPIFCYFDCDAPLHKLTAHGNRPLTLFGYNIATLRFLLSEVVGVNVCRWGDSYVVYEAHSDSKWSAHVHVGWLFHDIANLKDVMDEVHRRLLEVQEQNPEGATRALYYWETRMSKNGHCLDGWRSIVDKTVYSKGRNMRMLGCHKNRADGSKGVALTMGNQKVLQWFGAPNPAVFRLSGDGQEVGMSCDLIRSGMLLARLSGPFWNPVTVANWPDTLRCYRPLPTREDSKRRVTGGMLELSTTDGMLETFMQGFYRESWQELKRNLPHDILAELYTFASESPQHVEALLKLWTHAYCPGIGIDQKSWSFVDDSTTDVCLIRRLVDLARVLINHVERNDPIELFRAMLKFHGLIDLTCSRTSDPTDARRHYIIDLQTDFISQLLCPLIADGLYQREMLDILFMHHLCNRLLACSGYPIFSMQRDPTQSGGEVLPWFERLHDAPAEVRYRTYEHCFRNALAMCHGIDAVWKRLDDDSHATCVREW